MANLATLDHLLNLIGLLVICATLYMLLAPKFKTQTPKLSREELKTEKKRLKKLLRDEPETAILELVDPKYDDILQEFAKSHKRNTKLVELANMPKKERIKRIRHKQTLKKYGIDKDAAGVWEYITRPVEPLTEGKTRTRRRPPSGGVSPTRPPPIMPRVKPAKLDASEFYSPYVPLNTKDLTRISQELGFSGDGKKMFIHDVLQAKCDVFNVTTPYAKTTAVYSHTVSYEEVQDALDAQKAPSIARTALESRKRADRDQKLRAANYKDHMSEREDALFENLDATTDALLNEIDGDMREVVSGLLDDQILDMRAHHTEQIRKSMDKAKAEAASLAAREANLMYVDVKYGKTPIGPQSTLIR